MNQWPNPPRGSKARSDVDRIRKRIKDLRVAHAHHLGKHPSDTQGASLFSSEIKRLVTIVQEIKRREFLQTRPS